MKAEPSAANKRTHLTGIDPKFWEQEGDGLFNFVQSGEEDVTDVVLKSIEEFFQRIELRTASGQSDEMEAGGT